MSRDSRNSVLFDADTIRSKPRWLQLQIAAICDTGAAVRPEVAPTHTKVAPKKQKPVKRAGRVPRTRNAGTMTEAAYWGILRSGLRRLFRFWRPAVIALQASRMPCKGPNGQKWAYLCADCGKLFPRKQVQIDHINPVGALTCYEHVGDFIRRLTPEDSMLYAVRCLKCHQMKTNSERTTP